MKKSTIKKMSEEELMMAKAVCDFHPFDREGILIEKGDMKALNWESLLNWEDNFSAWGEEDEDDWSVPMKPMTRQERRKYRFRKDMARMTMARKLGYDMPSNNKKAKDFLSANHSDRKYFRGNKVQKKLGKAMTTKEGLDLMAQIEREAEEDREAERLEAERLFARAELEDKRFQFDELDYLEDSLKKTVSELIRTIYEANSKLEELNPQLNGLRLAKHYLEVEISKLEEVVNS